MSLSLHSSFHTFSRVIAACRHFSICSSWVAIFTHMWRQILNIQNRIFHIREKNSTKLTKSIFKKVINIRSSVYFHLLEVSPYSLSFWVEILCWDSFINIAEIHLIGYRLLISLLIASRSCSPQCNYGCCSLGCCCRLCCWSRFASHTSDRFK